MEVHGETESSPTSSSPPKDGSGVSVSRELLTAGNGGHGGDWQGAAAWGAHVLRGHAAGVAGRTAGPLPRPGIPEWSPRRNRRAPAYPPPRYSGWRACAGRQGPGRFSHSAWY